VNIYMDKTVFDFGRVDNKVLIVVIVEVSQDVSVEQEFTC